MYGRVGNKMAPAYLVHHPKYRETAGQEYQQAFINKNTKSMFQHLPFFGSANAHVAWMFVCLKYLQCLVSRRVYFKKLVSNFIVKSYMYQKFHFLSKTKIGIKEI